MPRKPALDELPPADSPLAPKARRTRVRKDAGDATSDDTTSTRSTDASTGRGANASAGAGTSEPTKGSRLKSEVAGIVLLLGSLFIGVGAMAATVHEVQTLSMPVTMVQLLIFFFASYGLPKLGQPIEIAACILPLSSPFAMLARAAQQDALWPHLLALLWQGAWTGLLIRIGTGMFRRNVLKSGRQKKTRRPKI